MPCRGVEAPWLIAHQHFSAIFALGTLMSDLSNLMRHSYLFPLGCPSWKRTKRLSPLHPILKGPQEYNQEPVRADGGMPVPLHEWVWSWPWSEPFIQDKKEGKQTQL